MDIETIYRKYFHDVFVYIRALSGNESLSEEITQETFLKVIKNIDQFDGRKDIRAWMFTIAKNTYYRYCKRNRIFVGEEFFETLPDVSPDVLDQIVMDETVQRVRHNVERLPEPYRKIIHLRVYGNLSFEQIGNCYHKSAGWARVTYHRARKMIQNEWNQEELSNGKN